MTTICLIKLCSFLILLSTSLDSLCLFSFSLKDEDDSRKPKNLLNKPF